MQYMAKSNPIVYDLIQSWFNIDSVQIWYFYLLTNITYTNNIFNIIININIHLIFTSK